MLFVLCDKWFCHHLLLYKFHICRICIIYVQQSFIFVPCLHALKHGHEIEIRQIYRSQGYTVCMSMLLYSVQLYIGIHH